MNDSSELRLHYADALLAGSTLVELWPRCTAWLIRLALEHALTASGPPLIQRLPGCSMRVQLLTLEVAVDADTQQRVSELWGTLSGHHHHHELSPTAAELRGWLIEARALVTRLEEASH